MLCYNIHGTYIFYMLWTHEGKDQGYPLTTLYTSSLKERMQIREFTIIMVNQKAFLELLCFIP